MARLRLLAVLALSLGLVAAALLWNPGTTERDAIQPRASWAPPTLTPDRPIEQSLVSQHSGLNAIEVLAARYSPAEALPSGLRICLRLDRLSPPTRSVATVCRSAAELGHNEAVRFVFAEQRDSRGSRYRATFWTTAPADLTLWATAEEAYAEGELTVAQQTTDGDLRMELGFRYRVRDALTDLAQMVVKWLWPLLCLGLLLGGPGLALGLWLARRHAFSYVLPLGLASWALLLLWSTTLHIPFASATIWAATVSSWAAALWFLHRQRVLGPSLCARLRSRETWLLMLVSACTLAMRLLNVRELVVPNWVDSLHHSAITQLIIDNAALPVDGGRFVSLPGMYYHFGFHAVAAALAQAAGIASYTAVLIVGQALLALAPLAVYSLTQAWTHRRRAGLIGALIVGCWSYMPAYYTSWGRYTQMAGLLVLSGAMLAVWQLTSPSLQPWRDRALAAALVAGLVLTHYRASAMLLPWAALALVAVAVKGRARLLLGASSAMLLSIIFAGPWLWRLLSRFTPEFAAQYGSLAAAPGANDAWPSALLSYRWTPGLLGGAALGALWALARKRWRIAMIGLWAGLCVLLPNLYWLGLPDVWLVDNVSVVISYWLPVGLLCGWLIADQSGLLVCWLRRHGRCASLRSAKVAGAVLYTGLVLWGSWLHVDVVNPSTVLVARQDMSAAAWISEHLPQDALILVNSVHWSNGARRGSDGGWWLPLLANRQVTLPNLLYIQGSRKDYAEINRFAVAVEQATDFCDPSFIQMLRERGVTHVYVGAKGGSLTPERLSGCPAFTLQYSQGPTRIYALASGGGSLRRARACSIWASVSATSSMATRCLR